MKIRKLIVFLLCAALLVPLSSCKSPTVASPSSASAPASATQEASPQANSPSWKKKTDPVTLTASSTILFLDTDMGYPLWGEDEVSRLIMSLTGVKLDIQNGTEIDDNNATNGGMLGVMLASGELSDLMFVTAPEDIEKLSDGAYSAPLEELAAQYCPDFWSGLDEMELLNNESLDGHVYTLRTGYNTDAVYGDSSMPVYSPRSLTYRQSVLDALNQSMPSSIEEFENLLYLIQQKGDALGITYPMRQVNATSSPLAEWMGVSRENYWDAATKSVRMPLRNEAWLPYLKMMGKWYRDGILLLGGKDYPWRPFAPSNRSSSKFFEESDDTTFATGSDTMRIGAYSSLFHIRTNAENDGSAFPYAMVNTPLSYQGEIQLQAPDNDIGSKSVFDRWKGALFITQGCLQKERAILFYQFLKSQEGSRLAHWGIEGTHYTLAADNTVVYTDDYINGPEATNDIASIHGPEGIHYWRFADNALVDGQLRASPIGYNSNLDVQAVRKMRLSEGLVYKKYAEQNRMPVLSFAEPTANDLDYEKYWELMDLWQDGLIDVITAPSESQLLTRWDQLMEELAVGGINDVETSMTARFREHLVRYQKAGYFTDIHP